MLKIKSGKHTYHVVPASAAGQKKLMTIIGAKIALNSAQASDGKINDELLYGALLTIGEPSLDDIVDIVLVSVVRIDQPDIPVDIESFQDHMHDYFMLIAKSIKANLDDFFTYLDTENAKRRNKMKLSKTL